MKQGGALMADSREKTGERSIKNNKGDVFLIIKIKSIIAVLSALALLATGTFAFSQIISQTNGLTG